MKYLALALLLCALASLSNADCYRKQPVLDIATLPIDNATLHADNATHHVENATYTMNATHCQDDVDKTWHPIGSQWRNSKCYDCDCSGCCSAYSTPKHFPDDCVSVFDSKACEYIVHKKDDPTVLCPIYGAVGK